jgi:hypothetical protein
VIETVLPVVGIGFLFCHFFDSASKKQVREESETECRRLMYCDGVSLNVKLLESNSSTIPEAMMHGLR